MPGNNEPQPLRPAQARAFLYKTTAMTALFAYLASIPGWEPALLGVFMFGGGMVKGIFDLIKAHKTERVIHALHQEALRNSGRYTTRKHDRGERGTDNWG